MANTILKASFVPITGRFFKGRSQLGREKQAAGEKKYAYGL
jgi:hypothetical protein